MKACWKMEHLYGNEILNSSYERKLKYQKTELRHLLNIVTSYCTKYTPLLPSLEPSEYSAFYNSRLLPNHIFKAVIIVVVLVEVISRRELHPPVSILNSQFFYFALCLRALGYSVCPFRILSSSSAPIWPMSALEIALPSLCLRLPSCSSPVPIWSPTARLPMRKGR
jgi:hypothetical protein